MLKHLILIPALAVIAQAQTAPMAEDLKRALDVKLQKIWKGIGTAGERTVLFQSVQAGRPTPGHYPFKVTLLIHDHETGYPPNHYYGQTCVGKLEDEEYVLSLDDFGHWDAQGRMTPDLSAKVCRNNPSAGVSAIPLSSLTGARASAGGAATPQPAAAPPQAMAGVAPGAYQCWANGEARMLLNFTVLGGNQYRDSEGHTGALALDARGRMTFRGGNLDGFLPAGFYAVYYAPGGRPTVSFRSSSGSEVTFCQR